MKKSRLKNLFRFIFLVLIFAIVVVSFAGCSGTKDKTKDNKEMNAQSEENNMDIKETVKVDDSVVEDDDTMRILFVGNSLLHHGKNENIGWNNEWGMAASSEENDYFHVVQSLFAKKYIGTKVEWIKCGAYGFESKVVDDENFDYARIIEESFGKSVVENKPDIVVFQMGDNIKPTNMSVKAVENAFTQAVIFCYMQNPDVKIILNKHFYANDNHPIYKGTLAVAQKFNLPIADLAQHNVPENTAQGLFEHAGVAGHPGDKGMECIARTFFSEIEKIIDAMFTCDCMACRELAQMQ